MTPIPPGSPTAPTPPPGFSVRLNFNSSVQLRPLEVYIYTMGLLTTLCFSPWTSTITHSLVMSGSDASTEVVLNPLHPFDDSTLEVRHGVLSLYKAGVAIAQGGRFTKLDAPLYVGDLQVGSLEVQPRSILSSINNTTNNNNNEQPQPPTNPTSPSSNDPATLTTDSGTITDPIDPNFTLTYHWDGIRIKAQDIFTAFLDALATAAEHGNGDPDAHIPAARSAGGDTVLSTWTVGAGMTWRRLKRALSLVWTVLVTGGRARFEGLAFEVVYEGVGIGGGRLLRFDGGGGGVDGDGDG